MTIPGVGPVTASAIRATTSTLGAFASGASRRLPGLTPRENSSGGKERLGRMTKMATADRPHPAYPIEAKRARRERRHPKASIPRRAFRP